MDISTPAASPYEFVYLTKRLLPRVPWWAHGHCMLGRAALGNGDLRLAYVSSLATLQILAKHRWYPFRNKLKISARLLLASCYVKGGKLGEAEPILRELLSLVPDNVEVIEEYAACIFAQERWNEVVEILKHRLSSLSPATQIAYRYAAQKMNSKEVVPL